MLEAFLVVSLCADRFISLRFPFQSNRWANLKVAAVSIVVQTAVACCLCGYTLGHMFLFGDYCNYTDDHKYIYLYTELAISTIVGEGINWVGGHCSCSLHHHDFINAEAACQASVR